MIIYKGYIMSSERDFVEVARQYDDEFADALDEYLPNVNALCEENDELCERVWNLEHTDYESRIKELQKTNCELQRKFNEAVDRKNELERRFCNISEENELPFM